MKKFEQNNDMLEQQNQEFKALRNEVRKSNRAMTFILILALAGVLAGMWYL